MRGTKKEVFQDFYMKNIVLKIKMLSFAINKLCDWKQIKLCETRKSQNESHRYLPDSVNVSVILIIYDATPNHFLIDLQNFTQGCLKNPHLCIIGFEYFTLSKEVMPLSGVVPGI